VDDDILTTINLKKTAQKPGANSWPAASWPELQSSCHHPASAGPLMALALSQSAPLGRMLIDGKTHLKV